MKNTLSALKDARKAVESGHVEMKLERGYFYYMADREREKKNMNQRPI